jgi:hypothetical protein
MKRATLFTVLSILALVTMAPGALAVTEPASTNWVLQIASNTSLCGGTACAAGARLTIDIGDTVKSPCGGSHNPNKGAICTSQLTTGDLTVAYGLTILNPYNATAMTANDQYEIDFTIGVTMYAMVFLATGAATGTLVLYWASSGNPSWNVGDIASCSGSCVSATLYQSTGNTVGFELVTGVPPGTGAHDGEVDFLATTDYLGSLGGTGTSVTGVTAYTYAGGTGCPQSGTASSGSFPAFSGCPTSPGTTPTDEDPNGSSFTWSLTVALPEFPFGLVLLILPTTLVYALSRHRRSRFVLS